MPTWRCPHCGTPQAETARCWVCRRSSTACATCRHFRRSVAAGVGYCGLDRRRTPLDGGEIRACWEARPVLAVAEPTTSVPVALPVSAVVAVPVLADGHREFVEVVPGEPLAATSSSVAAADDQTDEPAVTEASASAREDPRPWPIAPDAGWSFWSDLES